MNHTTANAPDLVPPDTRRAAFLASVERCGGDRRDAIARLHPHWTPVWNALDGLPALDALLWSELEQRERASGEGAGPTAPPTSTRCPLAYWERRRRLAEVWAWSAARERMAPLWRWVASSDGRMLRAACARLGLEVLIRAALILPSAERIAWLNHLEAADRERVAALLLRAQPAARTPADGAAALEAVNLPALERISALTVGRAILAALFARLDPGVQAHLKRMSRTDLSGTFRTCSRGLCTAQVAEQLSCLASDIILGTDGMEAPQ